eukprot:gene15422-biopygen13523
MVFPRPEWEKFRERIAQLPMSAQWWKRIFLGNAMDVEMDGTGRVLVSPELRSAAGLSKEAVLLGMGNHFELWDKATYDEQEAQAMQEPSGTWVDATFGRGGHSRLILQRLGPQGHLVAFDKDPEAIQEAARITDARFSIRHEGFRHLADLPAGSASGLLMDIG